MWRFIHFCLHIEILEFFVWIFLFNICEISRVVKSILTYCGLWSSRRLLVSDPTHHHKWPTSVLKFWLNGSFDHFKFKNFPTFSDFQTPNYCVFWLVKNRIASQDKNFLGENCLIINGSVWHGLSSFLDTVFI